MLAGMSSEPEQQIGVGTPDAFQRLWTPHRMAYIQAGPEPLREECPFCEAPEHADPERLGQRQR